MGHLLLAGVILLGVAFLVLNTDNEELPVVRGTPAPGFSLPRLSGEELALDDLRGKVVLLNFWATWCEPCEREMPAMEQLYQSLAGEDFELLAVAIDTTRDPVLAFREKWQLSFPIVHDSDSRVYRRYQSMGVPESLLIDREGQIIERYVGPRAWDEPEYVTRIRSLIHSGDS